jgi:hypothetical protein
MTLNLKIDRPMERRGQRRLPCRAPVRVYATPDKMADSFVLESTNLSADGVFLHTDLLFPVGDWLDLEFVVPGRSRPVRGRGKVVRVDGSVLAPGPGVAVHIPRLSDEERNALARLDTATVKGRTET